MTESAGSPDGILGIHSVMRPVNILMRQAKTRCETGDSVMKPPRFRQGQTDWKDRERERGRERERERVSQETGQIPS